MSPTRVLVLFAIGCGSSSDAPPAPTPTGTPAPTRSDAAQKTNDHPVAADAATGGTLGPIGGSGRRPPPVRYLTHGKIEIKGDYKDPVLRRYMRRKWALLTDCYTKELATNPKLAGTVTVKFKIDEQGKVASATASGLPKVDACAAEVVRATEFPKPVAGAVEITYGLEFAEPPNK
jgi:TonB family protein